MQRTPSVLALTAALSDLFNAEQTWQQAHVALVQVRAARFSDTAALPQLLHPVMRTIR